MEADILLTAMQSSGSNVLAHLKAANTPVSMRGQLMPSSFLPRVGCSFCSSSHSHGRRMLLGVLCQPCCPNHSAPTPAG